MDTSPSAFIIKLLTCGKKETILELEDVTCKVKEEIILRFKSVQKFHCYTQSAYLLQ